uniref:Thyrotropin-releasing hormone-degrading ectoenzyme n=1 Tax=Schizaphis graminum TaxID=13262 RepID=A0A2S2NE31_SCHGA
MSAFDNMRQQSIIAFLVLFAHVWCNDDKPTVDLGRLPYETVPERYVLSLEPDFDVKNPSFAGRVNISIAVNTTTDEITFNSKDLVLHEIGLTDDNTNSDIKIDSWKYAEDRQQVKVKTNRRILEKRKYTIRIRFNGYFNDDTSDIFYSSYNAYPLFKKRVATNNQLLQSTHARSVFPCYDEPRFKTPFNISIKIKRNEIALSNTPILNTANIDESIIDDLTQYKNWTWVHFIQTPLISTSMVAIFVGKLKQLDKSHLNLTTDVNSLYLDRYIMKNDSDQLNATKK